MPFTGSEGYLSLNSLFNWLMVGQCQSWCLDNQWLRTFLWHQLTTDPVSFTLHLAAANFNINQILTDAWIIHDMEVMNCICYFHLGCLVSIQEIREFSAYNTDFSCKNYKLLFFTNTWIMFYSYFSLHFTPHMIFLINENPSLTDWFWSVTESEDELLITYNKEYALWSRKYSILEFYPQLWGW